MIEDFKFEDFTNATIPQWEDRFSESFSQEGPGYDLYTENDEFKQLMDIKLFGKKRPDIVTGFELIMDAFEADKNEDEVNLAFTETIIELDLADITIEKMNQWL